MSITKHLCRSLSGSVVGLLLFVLGRIVKPQHGTLVASRGSDTR